MYIHIDANTWQTQGSLEGSYVTNNSFDTSAATKGGIVAEVLVYDRALTTIEAQAVEAALKARYATP